MSGSTCPDDMVRIPKDLEGKRILIVDDAVDEAQILRKQIEDSGMDVVGIATNAHDALLMTRDLDPALVIMDIDLKEPDLDGIELAKLINDQEPRPILLLSGYTHGEYIERAKTSGVITYLVKPVMLKELIPSIVLTIDRFREMVTLKATLDDMRETLANRKVIEQAKGLLMEKKKLTEREAFAWLRRKSQEQNKPMAEIARTLVMMQDLL